MTAKKGRCLLHDAAVVAPPQIAGMRDLGQREGEARGPNSAMPANTVSTMRPAGVMVSAHSSAKLRKPAPTLTGLGAKP